MNRLNTYYDRFAERGRFSLSGSLVYTSTYVVLLGIALLQFHSLYENRGQSYYLFMAPMSLLVGIAGLLHGIQVIRAVRRRRSTLQPM